MLPRLIGKIALLLLLAGSAQAKELALIIGIDQYTELPRLAKAVEDAGGYRDLFEERGFDVTYLTDTGANDLRVALATFYDRIEEGDTVVFVYSGHGWSDGSQNFLVPADTPGLTSASLASELTQPLKNGANGILDRITQAGAAVTIAIIDACRDNPFASANSTRSIGLTGGLAPIEAQNGSFIIYSAGANQTALDSLGAADQFQYSVFTRFFLPNLRQFGDLRRAIVVTRRQVQEAAALVEHNQRPAYYDELSGSACLTGNCEVTPSPSEATFAEREWSLISNSTDAAILQTFVERYRQSAPDYAHQAQVALAALQGSASETPQTPVVESTGQGSWFRASEPQQPPAPVSAIVQDCDAIAAYYGNPDNPPGVIGKFVVSQDADEAVAICEVAVAQFPDNPRMKLNLARSYSDRAGQGDYARAAAMAQAIFDAGYLQAGDLLAELYSYGHGVEMDFAKTAFYIQKAAETGLEPALASNGYLYLEGIGVPADPARGIRMLRALADRQSPFGEYYLGLAYMDGVGVARDPAEAERLLQRTSQHGWFVGYEELGNRYFSGYGVRADLGRAVQYYTRAAELGSVNAILAMGAVSLRGQGDRYDPARAFRLFQQAAAMNSPDAYNNLGYMYQNGIYVQQSMSEAVGLYQISNDLVSPAGAYNLGLLYMSGNGVPANYTRAAELIVTSLERGADGFIADSRDNQLPREFVRQVQMQLKARGVYAGAIDGVFGPQSRAAIVALCNCEAANALGR